MLVQEIFPDHELLIVPSAGLLWAAGKIGAFSPSRKAPVSCVRKYFSSCDPSVPQDTTGGTKNENEKTFKDSVYPELLKEGFTFKLNAKITGSD